MASRERHIRQGFGAVRPYLHGYLDLADFVKHTFGAAELERHELGPKSFHIESQIGDSVVVLETGDPPHPSATVASVYVYVNDVDAAYRRALEFGAISVDEPQNKPYQERVAGVKDSFGNIWWISTFNASQCVAGQEICGSRATRVSERTAVVAQANNHAHDIVE